MTARWIVVALLAGCGRIAFDPADSVDPVFDRRGDSGSEARIIASRGGDRAQFRRRRARVPRAR